jgi:hypothetical protein
VEAMLRASADKKTAQIFYPTTGLVFDSVEEAYEFYNLYSWEDGFGVRYSSWIKGTRQMVGRQKGGAYIIDKKYFVPLMTLFVLFFT